MTVTLHCISYRINMHAIKVVCMNNPRHTSPRRKAGLDGMQSHPLCRTDFSCAGMTERWGPVSNAQNALRWVPLLGRNSLKVVSICDAWAHKRSNTCHSAIHYHIPPFYCTFQRLEYTWSSSQETLH